MTPAPKRRWLRFAFSLRTLFVVVALGACWIGWGAWTIRSTEFDIQRMPFVVVSVFVAVMLAGAFLTWIVAPRGDE